MDYKNQHRLKDKKIEEYVEQMENKLGDSPFYLGDQEDVADTENGKVVIVNS